MVEILAAIPFSWQKQLTVTTLSQKTPRTFLVVNRTSITWFS